MGDFVYVFAGRHIADWSGGVLHEYEPVYIFEVSAVVCPMLYQMWHSEPKPTPPAGLRALMNAAFGRSTTAAARRAFNQANLADFRQSGGDLRYPFVDEPTEHGDLEESEREVTRSCVLRLRGGGSGECNC